MQPTFSNPTVRTCILTMADHPLVLPDELEAILAFTETPFNWDDIAKENNLPTWFVGSNTIWLTLRHAETSPVRVYTAMIPDFDMTVTSDVLDVTSTFPFKELTGNEAGSPVTVNINEDITGLMLWAVDWTVTPTANGVSLTAQAILRSNT